MNGTKIASKAKAQLANFMGKVFTHFSKPTRRFIEECIYGIQASGDTKLSYLIENNRNFIIRLKGRSVIFLKCTSPFIYRGEMHFRAQKMGRLQPSWDSCELDSFRGENKKAPENRSLLLNMRSRT